MDSSAVPAFTFLNPCNGHSPEDFQYQLLCASMELQKIQADGRLQESKLWRLQELLNMMTKERDEAREECKRLQECLVLQNTPAMGVDSPSSFIHLSSMVSSPSSSTPWSLQELEEHLNSDDFCSSAAVPTSFELQQALESFSQSCNDGQHMQSLFSDGKLLSKQVHTDSHQQFHMQNLDQALCFDALPCFNVSEAQKDLMGGAAPSSVRVLSRQSSSNSTSASVKCIQRKQCSVESPEDATALSPAFTEEAGIVKNAPPSLSSTGNHAMYAANQALPSSLFMDSDGSYMANAPALMPSLSTNGSYVTDNALSVTSYMANNEAALAMPAMPSMCDKAASATMCHMPSMDNFMAPLGADTSLPVLSSVGDHATSIVYIPPPTTSTTVKNVATPTSSAGNSAASLITTCTINPQLSKVSVDTEVMPSPPSKDTSSGATSTPKIASPTAGHATSACPPVAPRCNQQGLSAPVRQVHLPEPPEADPQVMLNSLPEKGKLLQAVMQAGPLLQTLLLAGPLPQWRHPPPTLSTGEIPKVSLAPINALLPYPTHMPSSAVKGSMGSFPIHNKGPLSATTTSRRRAASTELRARSKKLRKLSPLPTKQGLLMHMVTRRDEQRLAASS